ncbi:hypothetical protein GGR57DRAFT_513996 [Xylariaceae sp. FL1272]|nr:hypothetical protein GGR57DRAFT_513996 [Xylariaceae sp. FL1272]
MASTNIDVRSSERVPSTVDVNEETRNAIQVSFQIIDSFNKSLKKKDYQAVANLFCSKDRIISFLREGHELVKVDIDNSAPDHGPRVVDLRPDGSVKGIQFFTIVTNKWGSGRGLVRLVSQSGEWKIWTCFTSTDELAGHEEALGPNRADGVQHGTQAGRKNWLERRKAEVNFEGKDPDVLIIGCGQAGLTVHARLKMLQVSALTIDRSENIGDNWRNRYHQLVLHDPIWYDHFPYIEFPKFWPVFTPKDKLADFLKSYADMLELNVWNSTELESSTWDSEKKQWTVVLKLKQKDGTVETRTMHPKHIIQATGHSGKKSYPDFKGMETFKGDVLCHSSEFRGAKKDAKGRKAVVIGSCNSALDIAQDYFENGYDVTIIQRSSTAVMSSKATQELLLGSIYCENGPPVEDGDILCWSTPQEVFKAVNADVNVLQEAHDREVLDGLNKAGFKTDRGPMDCGLWFKYLQRGGGYYIDVGTSQLIIDGKVKVEHGSGVAEILRDGLRLENGTELEADEIICATGYQNMRTATELIFGQDVASKVGNVWGFDKEGETRIMWRRSGHPGLWLHVAI